jgi:hypothetical protein
MRNLTRQVSFGVFSRLALIEGGLSIRANLEERRKLTWRADLGEVSRLAPRVLY